MAGAWSEFGTRVGGGVAVSERVERARRAGGFGLGDSQFGGVAVETELDELGHSLRARHVGVVHAIESAVTGGDGASADRSTAVRLGDGTNAPSPFAACWSECVTCPMRSTPAVTDDLGAGDEPGTCPEVARCELGTTRSPWR